MHIYIGTFLIAFATLTLEITLSRFLSVSTWYHLAFFAISTAMLGMTAGATTTYIKKDWIERRKLSDVIALGCLGFAAVLPIVLVLLCLIPIKVERSLMPILSLMIITGLCTLPFYFSGFALSTVLTKSPLPIATLYAVDLIGAALGCLFVLGGLEIFTAPTLILICALIGVVAAYAFAYGSKSFRLRPWLHIFFVIITGLVLVNATTRYGIHQMAVKGNVQSIKDVMFEKWNSFSRVVVYQGSEDAPTYWGPSPTRPQGEKIFQYPMTIDGEAFTTVRKFSTTRDIEALKYDVTNIAYYLRPTGGACIIGMGGGRDVQSALLFGHESVVAIDVNPVFINLQKKEFREFAGLGNNNRVKLVNDEARSYLTHSTASPPCKCP